MTITRESETLSHFKRDTERVVQKLKRSGKPLVLTVKGQAELVVQDAAAYAQLLEAIERAESLAGIKQGLVSMERGEGIPFEAAISKLRKRHKIPKSA
jgi:PHD/YefM family antitoxin component YafN of YafNO toxin-antitoxin module